MARQKCKPFVYIPIESREKLQSAIQNATHLGESVNPRMQEAFEKALKPRKRPNVRGSAQK